MKKKNPRGGARKGAGRPLQGEERKPRVNIVISPEDDAISLRLGNGNRSKGIAIALRHASPP